MDMVFTEHSFPPSTLCVYVLLLGTIMTGSIGLVTTVCVPRDGNAPMSVSIRLVQGLASDHSRSSQAAGGAVAGERREPDRRPSRQDAVGAWVAAESGAERRGVLRDRQAIAGFHERILVSLETRDAEAGASALADLVAYTRDR
jgi:hypothetical protein